MRIAEKVEVVAKAFDVVAGDHAFFSAYVDVLRTVFQGVYGANIDNDPKWGGETYGASLRRYYDEGHIPNAKINEMWMSAVLAGLHNLIAEEHEDE